MNFLCHMIQNSESDNDGGEADSDCDKEVEANDCP